MTRGVRAAGWLSPGDRGFGFPLAERRWNGGVREQGGSPWLTHDGIDAAR